MRKVQLVVADIRSIPRSEAFSLILKDRDSERYIPVIIGISEARAILIELKQTKTQRPLTHELFLTLADNFSCSLLECNIIYYEEGVFFADLVMRRVDGTLFHLDARPSDAIALALKANVPFFMNEDIFNDNCLCDQLRTECPESELADPFAPVKLEDLSIQELKELLHDAVKCEDYELAAQVKEELDKRENPEQ